MLCMKLVTLGHGLYHYTLHCGMPVVWRGGMDIHIYRRAATIGTSVLAGIAQLFLHPAEVAEHAHTHARQTALWKDACQMLGSGRAHLLD